VRNDEFRDSVGFAAGTSYERRRIGEMIRQRITLISTLEEFGTGGRCHRMVTAELRRLADQIDGEP